MIPDHLDGGDVQTLIGRVDETEGGAEAHHVEVGVTLREEAALETCMDAANDGLFLEELLVGCYDNLLQLGVGTQTASAPASSKAAWMV